ncbi:MAG: site-specific DNA-methyltransferase [Patescibacteria group bacterium]
MNNFKNKIICGDAIEVLKTLPDESIDCVITSPPYFQQRDYQVEGQYGLEETPEKYIEKLINVFNEVKRILKKDGTCFVNLADTYGGVGFGDCSDLSIIKQGTNYGTVIGWKSIRELRKNTKQRNKSLLLIPHRFVLSMFNEGWLIRNDLIWIKKNAMPESVRDRWKKAHEHIFFFTKNKNYYFNIDTIRTPHKQVSIKRAEYEQGRNALGQNPSSIGDKSSKYGMPARVVKLNPKGAVPPDFLDVNTNCRAGETITEHYATYPIDLIIPLLRAGCPEGGIVLDIFNGSGTTCVAAKLLNRNYIGIDLSPKYCQIAEQRLKAVQPKLL